MELDNFIWDFDGTLFDTYHNILKSLLQTFSEYNLTFKKDELYRLIKKQSVGFATEYVGKVYGLSGQAILDRYHEIERVNQQDPLPYPGTVAVLKQVQTLGKQNFLYTHRDKHVFDYLAQHGLKDVFTGAVTASDDFPRKPDPSALKHIIQSYQLDPDKTVMIGDRALDVNAGKNANIHTIYFDVDQFHDDAGADMVVSNLSQIQNVFV
ncbi:MAG: HAD-IA family hydrolase [Lactobacillus sp.]|jgi:HAD superfamily hydrolase (TIGR01549 family)|nr:HAD-IA family hydrolase [Lactobacillus sp.]